MVIAGALVHCTRPCALKRVFLSPMCSSMRSALGNNAYACQCVHARFLPNFFWRRKWSYLTAFAVCVILAINCTIVLIVRAPNAPERDAYLDDVPEHLYQTGENTSRSLRSTSCARTLTLSLIVVTVLRKWYNFSGGK